MWGDGKEPPYPHVVRKRKGNISVIINVNLSPLALFCSRVPLLYNHNILKEYIGRPPLWDHMRHKLGLSSPTPFYPICTMKKESHSWSGLLFGFFCLAFHHAGQCVLVLWPLFLQCSGLPKTPPLKKKIKKKTLKYGKVGSLRVS